MEIVGRILAGIVVLEHFYFLYLEMFQWTTPVGMRAFGTTKETAESSKTLAANQGLYNGFLAAGLIWGIFHPDVMVGKQVMLFFLGCVIVAGLYGGFTVKRSILWIQALPALIALAAVLIF
jgi:putative membrane protein